MTLRRGVYSLVFLFVLTISDAIGAEEQRPRLDENPRLADYMAYIGEQFEVYGGEGVREVEFLRLISIDNHSRPGEPVEQYKMVFSTESTSTLQKNTYFFRHPQSGIFRLFIAPGKSTAEYKLIHVDMLMLIPTE